MRDYSDSDVTGDKLPPAGLVYRAEPRGIAGGLYIYSCQSKQVSKSAVLYKAPESRKTPQQCRAVMDVNPSVRRTSDVEQTGLELSLESA